MKKTLLTLDDLRMEAATFGKAESRHAEPTMCGVTDGKAVGTYLEQKFRFYLQDKYEFQLGSSASGIDFPDLEVDMKVTSVKQPQSSCPFLNRKCVKARLDLSSADGNVGQILLVNCENLNGSLFLATFDVNNQNRGTTWNGRRFVAPTGEA